MSDDVSAFLSAGLPGLTIGLSLGRGLSIQVDPRGSIAAGSEELNPPDEVSFIKDTTHPSALLVLHFYAIHGLVIDSFDFESTDDLIIYLVFSIGSTKKATEKKPYINKNTTIIFNEIKYIPLEVTLTPNEHANKLVVLVYACHDSQQYTMTESEHKMIGRFEAHMHTLLKYVNGHETCSILSKKGVHVGEIEFEFGATYGSFGFGNSYQLQNDLYSPADRAKLCMLPRLEPPEEATMFRGTSMYPRKLKHPPFIPTITHPVEDFEPEISLSKGPPPISCPPFPLMKQHMQRVEGLKSVYAAQPTRAKRICFIRKLLEDGVGKVDEEFEDDAPISSSDRPPPIPPALAILMNTSKFIAHAPGITRRKNNADARQSLPTAPNSSRQYAKPRSHSVDTSQSAPDEDFEAIKDYLFSNRRMSLAPTNTNRK